MQLYLCVSMKFMLLHVVVKGKNVEMTKLCGYQISLEVKMVLFAFGNLHMLNQFQSLALLVPLQK